MTRFEEVSHLLKWFKQSGLLWDATEANNRRIKVVERIREIAIDCLAPITSPNTDLRNFDDAVVFNLEVQKNPKYAPYKDAAHVLRACTHSLKSGKVEQDHIDWISGSYGGLDERWIAKLKQLHARRDKKNKALKKYCSELMQANPSPSASRLFHRIPKKEKAVTIDGFTIYRENTEEDGEKIFCILPTGKQTAVGGRAFADYFKDVKKSLNDNN
ncbi:MAG: hypothetical protein V1753_11690 [Pseudomonadota bacterium]